MSIPGSALTFLGAASGGDASYQISRSLRFNDDDTAYLDKDFSSAGNRQSWSWSGWVKRSELGSGRRALFGAYGAANDTDLLEFGFDGDGIYGTTNSTTFLTTQKFRDPSAWYHYFVRYNGTNIKFFINGTEVYSWAKTGDLGINGAWEHNIGRGPATGARYHDGYLADVHFVDGQALAATDFGKSDADTGVWNPIKYSGTYGTNGFHLDFSDNSTDDALGTDSSGNNNTWDDNNLSADGPSVTTTGNVTLSNNVNRNFFFKGSVGDTFSCTLGNHVWDSPDGATWTYRGTSQTSVTLTQIYVVITGSTDISFTNSSSASVKYWDLALSTGIANGSGTTTTFNIEAHGAESIDSLIDTPTNYEADTGNNGGNYATLNPLALGDNITLSNGNLQAGEASTSGHTWAKSTIGVTSGKWYVEVTVESASGANSFGLTNYSRQHTGWIGTDGSAVNQFNIIYNNGSSRTILDGNVAMNQTISGGQWTVGDVLQFAYDADNGKAWFGINNTWYQANGSSTTLSAVEAGTNATFTNFMYDSEYFFTTDHHDAAFTHNYGQRPFVCTPPTGFKSLCTTNLPDSLIADPSTAFDITTFNNSAQSSGSFTTTITPDLIITKRRDASSNWVLQDIVRGYGDNKNLHTNLDVGETSTGNITGVSDKTVSYGTNSNMYNTQVAWAWDAGANSNKTFTVTVVSDNGNKYRFDGHGTSAVTLDLEEGSTYVFDQSDSSNGTGGGHPLRFATQADAANNSEYTTGVTVTGTPGQAGAKTTITVASGAPTLYYYCSSHNGMGGQINTNSTAGATVLSGSIRAASTVSSGNSYSAGWAGVGNVLWSNSDSWSGLSAVSNNGKGYFSSTENLSNGSVISVANSSFGAPANGAAGFVLRSSTTVTLKILVYSHIVEFATTDSDSQTFANRTIVATNPAQGTYIEATGKCFWWTTNSNVPSISVMGTLYDAPQQPSIGSTVRANPSAGFSIVSYSGSGSSGTVGHSLNAAPELILLKERDGAESWRVHHVGVDDFSKTLFLNLTNEATTNTERISATSSSTFTLSSGGAGVNSSSKTYIAYCFAPVAGYSAFGSYIANADTSGDGPFVYVGFRPKLIMVKHATGTANTYSSWLIVDTERDTYNVSDASLFANETAQEGTRGDGNGSAGTWLDILSNGFKIRYDGTEVNGTSGDTYIYAAFAENPFKYSRAR
jgi:hypothetical protein